VTPKKATSPFVWILGGIGLASLGVGGGFGIAGLSQKSTLDECRPRCASSEVDTMQRSFLVGDVLMGVGIVSLGAAAILYFTGRASTTTE
jgi:hypothetical protein